MIVTKNISLARLIKWSWQPMLFLLLFAGVVAALYHFNVISLHLPWLAVSIIGTAVAFYVGFKNNSSYDRLWEARKIWGAIINSSRAWGMYVDGFVTGQFAKSKVTEAELKTIKNACSIGISVGSTPFEANCSGYYLGTCKSRRTYRQKGALLPEEIRNRSCRRRGYPYRTETIFARGRT